jgi:hypothetical protein
MRDHTSALAGSSERRVARGRDVSAVDRLPVVGAAHGRRAGASSDGRQRGDRRPRLRSGASEADATASLVSNPVGRGAAANETVRHPISYSTRRADTNVPDRRGAFDCNSL